MKGKIELEKNQITVGSKGRVQAEIHADNVTISGHLIAVWGSEDATAGGPAAISARRDNILKAQPGANFHTLEDVGHWAMYEAPGVINSLLLD